jgi:hypothetical protein
MWDEFIFHPEKKEEHERDMDVNGRRFTCKPAKPTREKLFSGCLRVLAF